MSLFRNWIHNLWLDNCEEKVLYCDSNRLTEQEYFQLYKWWLRKEYRHIQRIEKERNERRTGIY